MTESEYITMEQAQEEFKSILNAASVTDQDKFIEVDFSDTLTENITMEAPFYDFLVTKVRVLPTTSAEGAFRDIVIPSNARSKISANETASDITNTDADFKAKTYGTAVFARKIKVTDMMQMGNSGFDTMEYLRENATQDNYTAIDEALFNTSVANKWDGLKSTTQNTIDKSGAKVTLDDLNKAVRLVMNRGGKVDGIIATGRAIEQLVVDDNPNNQKIYPNNADVILGKWSTQVMTASGMVPLIFDQNINNRSNTTPAAASDAVYIVDSKSIEINILNESISKPLGAADLSNAELVATMARMGNLAPYRNASIVNIGET
jgi:hypothetical protein